MKILLVEDDELIRDMIRELLIAQEYGIECCSSAEAALVVAEKFKPDVVVTDVNLGPGLTGLQFGAELRRRQPTVGIVYVSGVSDHLADRVFETPDRFLAKPFRVKDLLQAIEAVRRSTP